MVKATVKGSQTEVGESANTVTAVSVFNAEQVDVTDYYKIRVVDGLLVVKAGGADDPDPNDPDDPGSGDDNPTEPSTDNNEALIQPVQTGDEKTFWLWILMIMSGGYMAEEVWRMFRRKRKN